MIDIKLAEMVPVWSVTGVATLAEAMALAPFCDYECLLVDLGLPDATGLDAVLRLKAACPEKALVVLTGFDDTRMAEGAIRAGALDYIVKSEAGMEILPRVISHAVERQKFQEALNASQHTSRALLDASHDLALLLDETGTVLTLNAKAADYLGRPLEEVEGRNLFDLLPPDLVTQRRQSLARALDTGLTVEFQDTDGPRWFTTRLRAVTATGAARRLCAMFVRDITEERAAAAKLADAKEEAEMASRAKTDFMARMSREIRRPLNDIIGLAENLAGEDATRGEAGICGEAAHEINVAGEQLLRMIDRITDVSMLETALVRDEASYRDLVELSPDLICVCTDGIVERINAAGLGMLRAPSPESCEGRAFLDFIHPDYQSAFAEGFEAFYGESHPVPVKIVTLAGRVRDMELSAVPLRRENSAATLVVARDTTDVTAAMRAVVAREHRIRAIMDTVLDGIITIDEHGTVLNANLAVERIFGYALSDVIGHNVARLMPEPDASRHNDYLRTYLGGGGGNLINVGREVLARRRDGTTFPVHLSVSELRVDKRRLFTGTIRDLSENKALAQRVAYLANHDPLTDLPNRALLSDRLSQAINQAGAMGHQVAVLTVDLDGFTTINDSLGHEVGSRLLRETAHRLNRMTATGATAARLGGDEFAVIVPQLDDIGAVTDAVQEIDELLAAPYQVEGSELLVPADIGISIFPRDGSDAAELLRNAEVALHAVKKDPTNNLGFFDAAMSSTVSERLTMERSIADALRDGQFELFFQPQVRLSDYALVGAEALIRWRHQELGIIPPDKFVPVAEESGLIVPLGAWVLREACRQLRDWNRAGLPRLRLGVNISSRQFREADLAAQVASAIDETGVDPSALDLELTESMLMADGEGTLKTLRELAALGVCLSIDDFGTGYSSLAYLKRFPVHTVKIDRAFVRDLDHDQDGRVIANAIISLAHSLSLRTIAEGVETEAQASLLARHGCDEIQGYLIGRPLPAADFAAFVGTYQAGAPARMAVGISAVPGEAT